jgi:zinc protease
MFATMMNDDTKFRTAEQMAVELQKLGSTLSVSSSMDGIIFSVQTLKKNLDSTLALLRERLLFPSFNPKEFKRYQKQTLESIKIAKTQPSTVADAVFAKLSYGNNILSIDESGTESSVAKLDIKDVEYYYNNFISRRDARLVVVGDIKQSEILSRLKFLDELPDKKIALPSLTDQVKPVGKTKIFLVDVPKAAQTEFRVGYNTGLKYDATGDYYRAGLMNYTLGGGFNSRLNINLREDKGWTYGARSAFNADKYTGDFVFSSGIRADATDSALTEVIKEMKSFSSSGIKEDELLFLKKAIGQRDALRYETGFQKAGFISRILEYNLPADYVDQQNKIL